MRQESRRQSGSKPRLHRRARPCLEEMENRLLLSVSASLLKDLNTLPASSDPSGFFSIGTITYFAANDGVHGNELWRTDGTAAGTYMVKDTNPNRDGNPTDFVNLNGKLLFVDSGIQLWISDGTAAGTHLLRTFNAADPAQAQLGEATIVGNIAVFAAENTDYNPGVWRTDGTAAGTFSISNVQALTTFTPFKAFAVFAGQDGTNGTQLWRTNGTKAGTFMIENVSSKPFDFTVAGNQIFFAANDGTAGVEWEVWRTDGTAAGTLKTLAVSAGGPGIDGLDFAYQQGYSDLFTSVGNKVFFAGYNVTTNDDPFWVSDGTANGTQMLIDPASTATLFGNIVSQGVVYFDASTPAGSGLWRTDGTAGGTNLVSSIYMSAALTTVNGKLIFAFNDGIRSHGNQFWATDGTSAGTIMLTDFFPGSVGTPSFARFGSDVYFLPNDGADGFWKTDGTVAGTTELAQTINFIQPNYFTPEVFATKSTVLFDGSDAQHVLQLWRSYGTAAGASLLKDINTGTIGSLLNGNDTPLVRFVAMNGTVYFNTSDPQLGQYLWKTNGAAGGTQLVAQISGPWNNAPEFGIQELTVVGNTLFFIAYDGTADYLWKSDGTASGTVMVTNTVEPYNLVSFEGRVYFGSQNGLWESDGTASGTTMLTAGDINGPVVVRPNLLFFVIGAELWESDGTSGGTVPLQNLNPGFQWADISMFAFHGELFYSSNANGQGWQLWKTDGTAGGTQLVKVLVPGGNAYPADFVRVNGVFYFVSRDATNGEELWRSDGTPSGTQMILDSHPPAGEYLPSDLTNCNGHLFFTAYDGTSQEGLWKSDGTAAGTTLIADIGHAATDFGREFSTLDGILFFQADDGVHGPLWESDGTAAGTFSVPGIFQRGPSSPGALTVLWNRLFFVADDGVHGLEPWTLTVTTQAVAEFFESSVSPLPQLSDAYPVAHSQSHAPNDRSFDAASARPSASPARLAGVRFLARQSPKDVDILFTLGWDQDR
jgi:ELWxxDGT repeat protein